MKTLIVFYSRTRKTAAVARTLAEELKADVVEVTDVNERSGPLNYLKASLDAFREKKTLIKPETVDLANYGLIYLGSPTWAGKPAPAIITLIDQCDLKGKDIILFTTMGRSGGENVLERMREKIEPRGARMVGSFIIQTGNKNSSQLQEEVREIIQEEDLKIYGI